MMVWDVSGGTTMMIYTAAQFSLHGLSELYDALCAASDDDWGWTVDVGADATGIRLNYDGYAIQSDAQARRVALAGAVLLACLRARRNELATHVWILGMHDGSDNGPFNQAFTLVSAAT
jgi:hypothetical protein